MKQRGRKSAASTSLVVVDLQHKPVECPAGLPREVEQIFRDVVASCVPQHFRKSDIPLLVNYSVACHLVRFYFGLIGEDETAFRFWTEATKLMISMATKLRLTPSSRTQPITAARQESPGVKPPWET
jgi:phage terminase small subunit